MRTGRNDAVSAHFVGSIVYIEKGLYSGVEPVTAAGHRRPAAADHSDAADRGPGATPGRDASRVDGFSAKKLRNYYLLNPEEEGERRYKLLLSQTDKASLIALSSIRHRQPKDHSLRVRQNFEFFEELDRRTSGTNLTAVCKGLAKLMVVDISLNRDQDNPQLIFESMNSTGRELSQADLIRNFILMGLEPQLQTRLYEQYWRPMEVDFGQEAYGTHFDSFMRHYLTVKTGEIPNVREVYEAFKQLARSPEVAQAAWRRWWRTSATSPATTAPWRSGRRQTPDLKARVPGPARAEGRCRLPVPAGAVPRLRHRTAVRSGLRARRCGWSRAYVFRRAVCAIPTNSLNKTFATFTQGAQEGPLPGKHPGALPAAAVVPPLPGRRRVPARAADPRPLQLPQPQLLAAAAGEPRPQGARAGRRVHDRAHPAAEREPLRRSGKTTSARNGSAVQQTWLHTLGNLTLTGYNSEYSDRPFAEKRDMEGGFKESPLQLNAGLGQARALERRRHQGSERRRWPTMAVDVWAAPKLAG